jgi:hypothetical protein
MNLRHLNEASRMAGAARLQSGGNIRPGVLLLIVAMVVVLVLALFLKTGRQETPSEVAPTAAAPEVAPDVAPSKSSRPAFRFSPGRGGVPSPETTAPAAAEAAPARTLDLDALPRTQETVRAASAIARLAQLSSTNAPLAPEQAREINAQLQQIVALGAPAVAAIHDFLQQHSETPFGTKSEFGTASAGAPASLRAGLLQALTQIGGPEAISVEAATLQGTVAPGEIGMLFRALDRQAPGEFNDTAVNASREALKTAIQKGAQEEVAGLFQILQKYGGNSVVPDLQNLSGQWRYYSLMALAGLPEGQGVSALTQMATGPGAQASGYQQVALQLLAQTAPENPAAQATLLQQAKLGQIPNWNEVASALAGARLQYDQDIFAKGNNSPPQADNSVSSAHHVPEGNQRWRTVETPIPQDQIEHNRTLVDQLLEVTTDPAGKEALQRAKALLAKPR